jgi:mitochondrial enoyl-[acyl-carrier protein] reductase / trans-2-enoyl-CoA reductase
MKTMKAVQIKSFGSPLEVAECVELPNPGAPGPDQALVALEASPINPSDVLTLSAQYGILPKLPAVPGNEGLGRVIEVGSQVKNVRAGDVVLLPAGAGVWREKLLVPAARLVPMPPQADRQQLAMLTVNPPTALLLLRDIVALNPDEWVIQNAANSGVGSYLITLAKLRGLKTVNVVRREALVGSLKSLGADAVVVDAPDLHKRIAEATSQQPIRLAIDAIGGEATARLAHSVAPGGTVVNYGAMSGEPCRVAQQDLIFRNVTLRGFWLAHWFNQATPADQMGVFGQLITLVAEGKLHTKVEATYPLSRIKDALGHAMKPGRDGKILLTPG